MQGGAGAHLDEGAHHVQLLLPENAVNLRGIRSCLGVRRVVVVRVRLGGLDREEAEVSQVGCDVVRASHVVQHACRVDLSRCYH